MIDSIDCRRWRLSTAIIVEPQSPSSRRKTPFYQLKSSEREVEMVLWFLVEGLDQVVLMRYTSRAQTTIVRWLERAGQHAQGWLHQLTPAVIQLDKLHT